VTDVRRRPAKRPSTGAEEPSLIERAEATPEGAREMAAARLAVNIEALLEKALRESGMSQSDLARALGVSDGRVSQILNSDGNLRVATIGKVFRALGFQPRLELERVETSAHSSTKRDVPSGTDWWSSFDLCLSNDESRVDPAAGNVGFLALAVSSLRASACLTEPAGTNPWISVPTTDWSTVEPARKRAHA
jgi:plasmid maintenance system antidote protein VapI